MMKTTTIWYKPELELMRNEFFTCTLLQLLERINQLRTEPVTYQEMRHQLIRMGLKKMIQIRWSKADISFLYENYSTIGDLELSKLLTARKSAFRVIDGEKVYRTFTKKHVDKKRQLLGLIRTREEVKAILQRNIKNGQHVWTKHNNIYTQGLRPVLPNGEVRIWMQNRKIRPVIKVKGCFMAYTNWLWKKHYGPIPKGCVITFKDRSKQDFTNIENLECITREENCARNSIVRYLPELRQLIHTQSKLKKQLKNG